MLRRGSTPFTINTKSSLQATRRPAATGILLGAAARVQRVHADGRYVLLHRQTVAGSADGPPRAAWFSATPPSRALPLSKVTAAVKAKDSAVTISSESASAPTCLDDVPSRMTRPAPDVHGHRKATP